MEYTTYGFTECAYCYSKSVQMAKMEKPGSVAVVIPENFLTQQNNEQTIVRKSFT